jgi:hypothetical protein
VIRVLEKLSDLCTLKQHNRRHVLESWRVKSFSKKMSVMKSHNAAHIIVLDLFKKPLYNFYRILGQTKGMDIDTPFHQLPSKKDKPVPAANHEPEKDVLDTSMTFSDFDLKLPVSNEKLLEEVRSRLKN